jgi:ABC-type nitrate/sulfonate/bicarbonate transport system substrate-binding protein
MRRILSAALACAALLGAGCGAGSPGTVAGEDVSLLLDFAPNAVHSGIYLTRQRGYDEALGARIEIRAPGRSTDAVKLLETGDADLAILDIHDLGLARERGADLVGVMAVVQRPLAAVLARPDVARPRDLAGKRAGVTGLPSDDAVLRSVVKGDGGDPARVKTVTIGFEAVRALLAGRVDAATAFWNAEGVALRRRRPDFKEFRVDDFGAPAYPELVLVATRSTVEDRRADVEAVVHALQRGYEEVAADPESAVQAMLSGARGLDRVQLAAELDAVAPAFKAGSASYGKLDRGRLEAWARWDVRFGILKRAPAIDRAFDFGFAGRSGRG